MPVKQLVVQRISRRPNYHYIRHSNYDPKVFFSMRFVGFACDAGMECYYHRVDFASLCKVIISSPLLCVYM